MYKSALVGGHFCIELSSSAGTLSGRDQQSEELRARYLRQHEAVVVEILVPKEGGKSIVLCEPEQVRGRGWRSRRHRTPVVSERALQIEIQTTRLQ
jgi:hypothetical protein